MLQKTSLSVSTDLVKEAQALAFSAAKITLNEPTGLFFYDPWAIKQEFKGSVWQKILEPLGNNIGEARIIVLDSPSGYTQHADIDDRYHLNIVGEGSYLLDLDKNIIHPLVSDGYWYEMDAGRLHSAVAIGKSYRIQLVVRKLLNKTILNNPVPVTISGFDNTARYDFDNKVSPWLNKANKQGIITNFSYNKVAVNFEIELDQIDALTNLLDNRFDLIVTT
jgi:hypothetical protein